MKFNEQLPLDPLLCPAAEPIESKFNDYQIHSFTLSNRLYPSLISMFKPKTIGIAALVASGGFVAFSQMGDLKTPGMRNIEKRHAAAGGGHSHTPGMATKLGDEENVEVKTMGRKGGTGTPYHEDKFSDQKPEVIAS